MIPRLFTLVSALSLIFAVAVDAHIDTPLARHHVPAAHRMHKIRANGLNLANALGQGNNAPQNGVSNAAAAPNQPAAGSPAASSGAASTTIAPPANSQSSAAPNKASQQVSTTAAAPTAPTPNSDAAAATSNSGLLGGVGSALSSLVAPSSSASSSASTPSSSASTSSIPISVSTPSQATPSVSPTPTPVSSANNINTSPSEVTVTSSSAAPSESSSAPSSGPTPIQRNTIIILVAIGASIGAAGIIWTIIRKWKFRPSSSFEDRMQPIDWQPTAEVHNDHDITEKLSRNGSTRSHGSFTSGNNHDQYIPDLPPHDFTPGPAHLAPVGTYADLQRGPSPQPDQSQYQYEIPNPHGQYYNNAPANPGAYQGEAYDFSRGY
ncbi:hypothetical protein K439DRAFT_450132 [Ramaria rubella]|nr:hypothetical protein K439DRAFT_450132 [Ramaria rubella]